VIERLLSLLSRQPRLRWLQRYLGGARHDCLPCFRRWRIEGPFDSSYSLAIVNREIALALADFGHSVTLESRDGPGPFPPNETFLADHPRIAAMWRNGAGGPAAEICLRNTYPPFVDGMAGERRGLVCYAWEESRFPREYVDAFNAHLDVVTVTSGFVAKVLRDNGVRVPIRVIGDGVDQVLRLERAALTDGKAFHKYWIGDEFCFLHISTCLPRKGVDVLLAAWAGAFDDNDAVVLVIKASANQHHRIEDDVAALASTHPRHARIVVINDQLPADDIYGLLRRADVVVAPSRGEGFGLPLAEALALGKPVIATAYGGQSEFCASDNAWLCDYDFAYAQSHVSAADSVWVEPRIDSLIACLRQAWSAPASERARRGERGRAVMRQNFTWKHVAQRLCAAVVGLEARSGVPPRQPKIGLVSTWNTRCAIAEHARALAMSVPQQRLVVFADRAAQPVRPDQANVVRCWDRGAADALDALYQGIRRASIDAMVVEFSPGFYHNAAFARLIARLAEDRIAVYIFLHWTADAGACRQQLPDASALRSADRLFVHSVHDLNNLKVLGLVGNVTLFPFGVPARAPSTALTGHPKKSQQRFFGDPGAVPLPREAGEDDTVPLPRFAGEG
jgi:glycosyltransferase involved in cell wall biosynthesis